MEKTSQIKITLHELLLLAEKHIGHLSEVDSIKIIHKRDTLPYEVLAILPKNLTIELFTSKKTAIRMSSKIYPSEEN